jgi:hypothetical protein
VEGHEEAVDAEGEGLIVFSIDEDLIEICDGPSLDDPT